MPRQRGGDCESLVTHRGGCHCGTVRFCVTAPADLIAHNCNCSMCCRSRYQHLIVPAARFQQLSGRDALVEYRFNTGVARHLFCRSCGVKAFYVPRSNPDGISVNLRCLEPATIRSVRIESFDGRNWETAAPALAHLSTTGQG